MRSSRIHYFRKLAKIFDLTDRVWRGFCQIGGGCAGAASGAAPRGQVPPLAAGLVRGADPVPRRPGSRPVLPVHAVVLHHPVAGPARVVLDRGQRLVPRVAGRGGQTLIVCSTAEAALLQTLNVCSTCEATFLQTLMACSTSQATFLHPPPQTFIFLISPTSNRLPNLPRLRCVVSRTTPTDRPTPPSHCFPISATIGLLLLLCLQQALWPSGGEALPFAPTPPFPVSRHGPGDRPPQPPGSVASSPPSSPCFPCSVRPPPPIWRSCCGNGHTQRRPQG